MSICGVVLHAHPSAHETVRSALLGMPGVDVHAMTEEGRMVVTVDQPNDRQALRTLEDLREVDGVLSTELVFSHPEPTTLPATPGVEQ
jgi:nitrate reductase NapD